jgi:hypothetical protein
MIIVVEKKANGITTENLKFPDGFKKIYGYCINR